MWPHFINLLSRSWANLVAAMGTTTLAVIVGFVGFVFVLALNLLFKLRKDGWSWSVTVSHFSQNLRDSVVPTVIGTIILWGILFGAFVVRTVYDDHSGLVVANEQLTSTNRELDQTNRKLTDENKRLNNKSCPVCPIRPMGGHPDVPELCRVLSRCPSNELVERTVALANRIDRIYQDYMRKFEQLKNQAQHDSNYPDGKDVNSGRSVREEYDLRDKWLTQDTMAEYDKCCQTDAVRYREELLNRVSPGLHDTSMDDKYAISRIPFVGSLHDIVTDLRKLAGNVQP